jgi:hypothetical protein
MQVEGKTYEVRPLGGGRFRVVDSRGTEVGQFVIKGPVVLGEDVGIEGVPPVALLGEIWGGHNLSTKPRAQLAPAPVAEAPSPAETQAPLPEPAPPPPPEAPRAEPTPPAPETTAAEEPAPDPTPERALQGGRAILRLCHHADPDANSLKSAKAYHAWLRDQPGVRMTYVARDPSSGKTCSVTIWENQEKLTASRFLKAPKGAAPLKSQSVELMFVIA